MGLPRQRPRSRELNGLREGVAKPPSFSWATQRGEALKAYQNKLKAEQIDEIEDAPETAIVTLQFGIGSAGTKVTIIPEG